ncbi:MAG TPA: N-acetyltransferase [Firmicutes bacterium]|nr:N-acetyltransferase [Bacillota bacterium]
MKFTQKNKGNKSGGMKMLHHTGTCYLETERLILRPFKLTDAEDAFKNWTNDDEVTRYLSWPTHTNIDVTRHVIQLWEKAYEQPNVYQWAIIHKVDNEVIGSISLLNVNDKEACVEAGYCLSKQYWKQGITPEALSKVLDLAFNEVGFKRITARHHIDNEPSGRVMKKVGMTFDKVVQNDVEDNQGNLTACAYYKIEADDWK